MRSRRVVVGVALLILGGAIAVGVVLHSSESDGESVATNAEPRMPGLAAMVKRSHAAPRAERLAHATDQSSAQRHPRPPVSTNYGPSSPCGDIDFDRPPFRAADIRVAGAGGCEEAVTLVGRAHDDCSSGNCDIAGYRCNANSAYTQVLDIDCRSLENKVTWSSVTGG